MKKINKILLLITAVLFLVNCQEDDKSFGDLSAPSNLVVNFEIQGQDSANPYGDGSGIVAFSAKADNAISYKYIYSDGSSQNAPNGKYSKRFVRAGINEYTVTVIASGRGGLTSTATLTVEVKSDFTDEEAVAFLTGGTQKNWYWSASEPGHLGVGPNNSDASQNYYAAYYQATAWEKAASSESSCLYENVLQFSLDANGDLKYELDNGGQTFF